MRGFCILLTQLSTANNRDSPREIKGKFLCGIGSMRGVFRRGWDWVFVPRVLRTDRIQLRCGACSLCTAWSGITHVAMSPASHCKRARKVELDATIGVADTPVSRVAIHNTDFELRDISSYFLGYPHQILLHIFLWKRDCVAIYFHVEWGW